MLGEHLPVKHIVIREALSEEKLSKYALQILVIGLIFKVKTPHVVEVKTELGRNALTKHTYRGTELLLQNSRILLLLRGGGKSLPGEFALEKVDQHVAQRLNVISSGRLNAEVHINRGISRSPRETLVLLVGNMLQRSRVLVQLAQPKVYNVNQTTLLVSSHEKILGFNIPIKQRRIRIKTIFSSIKSLSFPTYGGILYCVVFPVARAAGQRA